VVGLAGCTAVVDGSEGPHGQAGGRGAGGSTGVVSATSGSSGAWSGASGAAGATGGASNDGGMRGDDASVDAPGASRLDAAADATVQDGGFDGRGMTSDGGDIGPVVMPECPGDPTAGWTEYADTFHLEYPYNLMPSDRYTFENGIHTFWVFPTDMPHAPGNTTAPRTEAHWTNFTTGRKMWTGDVLVESPSTPTTIFQVHTTATGAGPVYIRVAKGDMSEINGQVLARGVYDKWINLKVAFEAATSTATIYVNNCQKLVLPNSRPGSRDFYFKNGVYTCTSTICRDHYKNIHLYQR
jgi:hypothetical protein